MVSRIVISNTSNEKKGKVLRKLTDRSPTTTSPFVRSVILTLILAISVCLFRYTYAHTPAYIMKMTRAVHFRIFKLYRKYLLFKKRVLRAGSRQVIQNSDHRIRWEAAFRKAFTGYKHDCSLKMHWQNFNQGGIIFISGTRFPQ